MRPLVSPYNIRVRRPLLVLIVGLAALVGLLVGLLVRPSSGGGPSGAAAALSSASRADAGPVRLDRAAGFADVAERIDAAVVNIDAISRTPPEEPATDAPATEGENSTGEGGGAGADSGARPETEGPSRGSGSGVIISSDGSILTNYHVVEGAERITVHLADRRSFRARAVGVDPDLDIALLKVEADGALPVAPLGRSSEVRIGEWVCAIGNPLGWDHTLTVGVVSQLGRKLFDDSLDNYIQTDAAIHFGNSGGPLVNARGEVIGINAAVSTRGSGIGFAVPIDDAMAVLPQLRARGRVIRGYLGVTLRDFDRDLGQSLGIPGSVGAIIEDVAEGSPAAGAGLRPYDLLVGVGGDPVRSSDGVIRAVSARTPGSTVRLSLVRDGSAAALDVVLTERPPAGAVPSRGAAERGTGQAGNSAWPAGLRLSPLDARVRRRLRVPETVDGVLVTSVDPLGPADEAEIERDDVVLEINRHPVRNVADADGVIGAARPGTVLTFYMLEPGGYRTFRVVRLDRP